MRAQKTGTPVTNIFSFSISYLKEQKYKNYQLAN